MDATLTRTATSTPGFLVEIVEGKQVIKQVLPKLGN